MQCKDTLKNRECYKEKVICISFSNIGIFHLFNVNRCINTFLIHTSLFLRIAYIVKKQITNSLTAIGTSLADILNYEIVFQIRL